MSRRGDIGDKNRKWWSNDLGYVDIKQHNIDLDGNVGMLHAFIQSINGK